MHSRVKTRIQTRGGRSRGGARAPHEPKVGDRLGDYRLCLELARGGMATVFLAHAPAREGVHRFVALKCIRHELATNPTFIDMFFDEARIAAQVQHANVCSVLDFDEWHGTYFLVMEYLSGRTLHAVRGAMSEQRHDWDVTFQAGLVARMLADACEGLHSVHETRNHRGELLDVVHRDVSPANIFVTYNGNVKIIDFGVACGSEQRHKTRTGVLKGKYAYLAPELLRGAKPDLRADIWGLGVVAWELLTQRRLFDKETEVETLGAISSKADIPVPSKVRKGIPKLLDDIVMQALRRDPDKRCDSARTLGRLFNRYLTEAKLSIGLAEVSESMTTLFPEGRTLNRKILEIAEQMDEQTVADIEPQRSGRSREPASIEIHEGTLVDERGSAAELRSQRIPLTRVLPPSQLTSLDRKQLLTAGSAGAVVAAVALLLAFLVGRSTGGEPPAATAQPTTTAPAQPATKPTPPPSPTPTLGVSDLGRLAVVKDIDPVTGEIILRLRPIGP